MLKIIGAGFGRTGTLSLKKALEMLGMGPCYHMDEMIRYPKHMDVWKDATLHKPVNWNDIFADYQSTLDFPASLYYRELLAAYPDSKVILTVREPERWYQSMYETAYTMMELYTPAWVKKYVPPYKRFADCSTCSFGMVFSPAGLQTKHMPFKSSTPISKRSNKTSQPISC